MKILSILFALCLVSCASSEKRAKYRVAKANLEQSVAELKAIVDRCDTDP